MQSRCALQRDLRAGLCYNHAMQHADFLLIGGTVLTMDDAFRQYPQCRRYLWRHHRCSRPCR